MASNNQDAASAPGSKQLKVDNWGTFFLHRLQMLYEKNENCDVTLQFHDGGEINVHRLVITTCTDYFQSLTVTPDNRLVLPPLLKHNCVLPIVNFMYTGKLDFKVENHHNLLSTAKLLNMTILVKLLNAQVNQRENKVPQPSTPVSKAIEKKVVTPPTPTVPSPTLPGKKLPFWKKRTTPGHLPEEFYQSEALQSSRQVPVEPAGPTRFEWPEEGDVKPTPVSLYSPSFDSISYDSELLVKPAKRPLPSDNQETTQGDAQDFQPQPAVTFAENIKRFKSGNSQIENCFGLESDDDDDDDGHFESVHNNDDCGDDDNDNDVQAVTQNGDSVGERSKSFNDIIQTEVPARSIAGTNVAIKKTIVSPTVSTPKPILKPLTSDLTPTSNQSKKVRFSLSSEGKENTNKKVEKQIVIQNKTIVSGNEKTKITANTASTNKTNSNNNSNHAKIIAEVLKKYPELVKNNKNIRLKIMTPNNKSGVPKTLPTSPPSNKPASGKSKVSYVVVKSDVSSPNSSQQEEIVVSTPMTGAENTTGPWFCHTCGTNSEPMNFETYYLYRRHLQDVHMERIDARICEHCGYKSSKRNLHLYHLYTKHNIQPPRNISFPKCDQCDYIALSDSLLIKHRNTHVGVTKDYICKVCNAGFKSHGALQGHMQTSLHNENPHKEYQCDFCDKVFSRNINLKAHVRTAHKDESRKLYDEEDPSPQQNLLQVIQVPVIDSLQNNLKGQQTLLLPAGMTILAESPSVPLLPSSESEALNNVASGIATSLNLNESNIMSDQTVIFLDSNSELLFDQSGNPVVMAETTVVTDGGSGEYIIPEMIASGNSISQVFTTQAQPVVTTASGEVVPITVCTRPQTEHVQIHQQQPCSDVTVVAPEIPSTDHTYADESVQQSEEIEEPSQTSNGRENSGISIFHVSDHSSSQPQEMEKSDHNVAEGSESGRCIVGDDDHLISRPVETIQFAASNASNEMSSDSNTQPMEVCERGSIIIQPPSVIQHPTLNVAVQPTCLQDVENVAQSVTSNNGNVQCVNSNSVIVNGATPTLLVAAKTHPKDELVRDWDDFGDDEVNADCSLVEIVGNEEADDIRPSRPTIELEESILPDM